MRGDRMVDNRMVDIAWLGELYLVSDQNLIKSTI